MTQLASRNVLITGGASGIGRLMAIKMAQRNANVIIWDIDKEKLNQVVEEIKSFSQNKAYGFVCDLSKRTQISKTAKTVREEIGPIDILVNNAGVVSGKNFLEISDKKIESTFAVNTMALFWTTKAFLPEMIKRNSGHMVTVASAAGTVGVAKLSDYCASKFAAVGFDESLRVELKKTAPGVKTTVVCPYYIDTGMFTGVKTRFSFLLPILKEERVAERIVDAIQHNRARLMMPPLVFLVPLLRLLPTSLFDGLSSFLGINMSMDEFVGHANARTSRKPVAIDQSDST